MPNSFPSLRLLELRIDPGRSRAELAEEIDTDDQSTLLRMLDTLVSETRLRALTGESN